MTSSASCKSMWQKFEVAKAKELALRAMIDAGKKGPFDLEAFKKLSEEARKALTEYEAEASRLIPFDDGRLVQQRDYLALRRFIDGCVSTKMSTEALWTEVTKTSDDLSNGTSVSEEGRIENLLLCSCKLTSVGNFEALTALGRLSLADNQLTSISIPETLTALTYLELSNNQLTSISIPETLTALKVLRLENNRLTSISIPETWTALKVLWLENNQLTSISIPQTLTTLDQLLLGDNRLASISIPETLTALEWLDLSKNQLTSISIPKSLTIENVDLSYNLELTSATKAEATERGWKLG